MVDSPDNTEAELGHGTSVYASGNSIEEGVPHSTLAEEEEGSIGDHCRQLRERSGKGSSNIVEPRRESSQTESLCHDGKGTYSKHKSNDSNDKTKEKNKTRPSYALKKHGGGGKVA